MLSRRQFLEWVAGMLLGYGTSPSRALASTKNLFSIVRVRVGSQGMPRSNAPLVLLRYVVDHTSVEARLVTRVARLGSPEMFESPFALWVGGDGYEPLSDQDLEVLRRYLLSGGFLLVDNVGVGKGYRAFYEQCRLDLERAMLGRSLSRIPKNHVLYRSFFKVSSVAGRVARRDYLEGLKVGDRLAVVFSHNDLTGAWAQDSFGRWMFTPVPGGERQRTAALRLGTNVVMYSLLLDYKDQQTHIDYLLKQRRLLTDPTDPGQNREAQ